MLKFNENTLKEVQELYNLNKPGRMEDALELFENWIEKQNHFVYKSFSKPYLERLIIASKGSVERAKERLDKICTVKTLMPQFFEDMNAKEYFEHIRGKITHLALPQLTEDNDRIIVVKLVGNHFSTKMILDGFKTCIVLLEYLRAHDYAASYQIIVDFREAGITEFATHLNILDFRQTAVIALECYGLRVKGIHLVTESKLVNILLSIAKQVVISEKLRNRIHVHKNAETLYEILPKQILPEDLGGSEKSINDLNDDWMEVLSTKEFREYWGIMIKACTDESKRQSGKFNETYMGMPGSFRKLNVD